MHAQSDELAKNGGFEIGAGMPDGWAVPAGYGAWDGDQRVSGAKSLRLTNGDAGVYHLVTQEVVCSPGALYTFSAQVKGKGLAAAQPGSNGAGIYLEYTDGEGNWLGGDYPTCQTGDFGWTRLGGRDPIPIGARRMTVGLYLRKGTTGTAWFDDVSVQAAAPPLQSFLRSPNYHGLVARRDAAPWTTDVVVGCGGAPRQPADSAERGRELLGAGRQRAHDGRPGPADWGAADRAGGRLAVAAGGDCRQGRREGGLAVHPARPRSQVTRHLGR